MDGIELYGSRYKSLFYLASIHNDGGSNSVCDQFHGGQGILIFVLNVCVSVIIGFTFRVCK